MPSAAGTTDSRYAAALAWRRALELTGPIGRDPSLTLPRVVEGLAERLADAPALVDEHAVLSFRDLARRARTYARWALRQGIAPGDTVCLLLPNCAEYLAVWLGITRVGGVVALVNTNLVGDALTHCLGIVAPRHVIADAALLHHLAAVRHRLGADVRCWGLGGEAAEVPRLDTENAAHGPETPDAAAPTLRDRALYIYTSGTTGLPKAASVSHFRLMQWSHWFAGMMDVRPDDRMYDCLPLYHSIGGVVATCATLVGGGSVVIRERFSTSRFWDDVVESRCTLFQYIGELCRYLVNTPPHPRERDHHLRLCCGNGLSGPVWEAFQARFQVPQILEFYAATEGSFSLYNAEGKPGAIGRIPPFLSHRFPVALVRHDVETGEPLRGADAFCVRCADDEPGEAIGRIADGDGAGGRFEGYTDRDASGRKVLHDVFAIGDAWYRTGDLMRRDKAGYYYFVDRVGDTFRWKGENVSTTEVAETIAACAGVAEAVVYGVAVPGAEGRAGTAAIVPGEGFDLAVLRRHLAERLPDYARPLFVRLLARIAATGTFKPQKQALAQEGFDLSAVTDPLYFDDRAAGAYVPFDAALHRRLVAGEVRL